jgi:hypothetical protein
MSLNDALDKIDAGIDGTASPSLATPVDAAAPAAAADPLPQPEAALQPLPQPVSAAPGEVMSDASPEAMLPEGDQPVQVAGLLDAFKGKGARPPLTANRAPLDTLVERQSNNLLVFRDMTPQEKSQIDMLFGTGRTTGTPRQGVYPNLNVQNIDDAVKQFGGNIATVFEGIIEDAKRGKITLAEIVKQSEAIGLDEMTAKLRALKPGDMLTHAEMVKSNLMMIATAGETQRAVVAARAPGATDQQKMDAARAIVFQGAIMAKTVGNNAEYARGLAFLNALRTMPSDQQGALATGMAEIVGGMAKSGFRVESIDDGLRAYATLNAPYQQQAFARGLAGSFERLKANTPDVLVEIYMNALLASPATHMRNMLGNTAFTVTQIPERALAGMIGQTRQALGWGSQDRAYVGESLAMFHGMATGMTNAFRAFGTAMKTGEPSDLASKVEARRMRAITAEQFDIDPGSALGAMVNFYGNAIRLPGRFLIAEDEMFKSVARSMSLHADKYKLMVEMRKAGKTDAEIEAAAVEFITKPNAASDARAMEFARQVTLQDDLTGWAKDAQGVMGHPVTKIFVPFYKTPTNIVRNVLDRTPLPAIPGIGHVLETAGLSKYRAEIAAGGAKADLARAKLAMGSTMLGTLAYSISGSEGDDVIVTGAGPSNVEARQAWTRQGNQPYSIGFKQEDGNYLFASYNGMEPLSAVIAIAADYAHYAKNETNGEVLDALAVAGTLSIADYMTNLPMLQGVADLFRTFGGAMRSDLNTQEKITAIVAGLGKQATGAAITTAQGAIPVIGSTVAGAAIERVGDPTVRSSMSPENTLTGMGSDAAYRAFSEALQAAKARNPLYSKDLPPELNLWGEQRTEGFGTVYEIFSPIRIKQGKYKGVDDELVRLNLGIQMPDKAVKGVNLNAEQYNRMLKYMNEADPATGNTLLDELRDTIGSKDYRAMLNGEKIDTLRSVVAAYKRGAQERLLAEEPRLARMIEYSENVRTGTGKRPSSMPAGVQ